MLTAIRGLIHELRAIGIPISTTEHLDASRALTHVDLADRGEVRAALRTTLVKTIEHERAFEVVFDLYFAAAMAGDSDDHQSADEAAEAGSTNASPDSPVSESGSGGESGRGSADGSGGGGVADLADAQIKMLLLSAVQRDDQITVKRIASEMVDRHARIEPGRAVAGTFYMVRTLRAIDLDGLLVQLLAADPPPAGPTSELLQRLTIEHYEDRIEGVRREIESQIRRRLVADRGSAAVARTLREPLPEDVDFLQASAAQVADLRSVLQPLARAMATRLQHKRLHARRGRLDFRRTMRLSMATGGIPVRTVFHPRRPAKPQLMVLADISGSVSAFAAFTLQLAYALRSEFAAVRCFVFVDGVSEVTQTLNTATDIASVARQINSDGAGVWLDGRSDYGHALEAFWEEFSTQITGRTNVIVLGDARTNYHAPREDVLSGIRRRAHKLYWLNPEPVSAWDSGDSVIGKYAVNCDGVFECRNARQLKDFVELLGS